MRVYLRKMREQAGLTQLEVAKKLNISEGSYSLIENGKRQIKMSIDMAKKLAEAFEVPIDTILENEAEVR